MRDLRAESHLQNNINNLSCIINLRNLKGFPFYSSIFWERIIFDLSFYKFALRDIVNKGEKNADN